MNNYIKYLQAGGTAQVNDAKNQVAALVEAAMSGDKKAAQQIEQIMQAAQQGDQQAQQIAGLIQQVAEQLQGGQVPQEEKGGSVPKAENGTNTETIADWVYIPSTDKTRTPWYATNLEGYQFPAGSVSTAAVYDPTDYTTYTRNILYGTTPAQNDTIYGVSPVGREEMSYGRGDTPSWLFDEVKTKSENAFHRDPHGIYKCGGEVKKGGKGLPIPTKKVVKNAKGGCPCQLKKVGGKLVEVDSCNGKIVK